MSENLIENYERWLRKSAKRLSQYFGEDFDECYQVLALLLLQNPGKPLSAWRQGVLHMCEFKSKEVLFCDLTADLTQPLISDPKTRRQPLEPSLLEMLESLSDEEFQVAFLFVTGMKSKDIAEAIGTTTRTVNRILKSIKNRLRSELDGA